MKILHIKVNATATDLVHEKIRERILNDLKQGLVITDNFVDAEVIEIDGVVEE